MISNSISNKISVKEYYKYYLPNGDLVIVYINNYGHCSAVVINSEGKTVAVSVNG